MVNDLVKGILLGVVVLYVLGGGLPGGTQGSGDTGNGGQITVTSAGCNYAPTVQLGANNKFNSGQTDWGNWKYILNGGTTTTDADGSFEVTKGDTLSVLVADSNSSTYYRAIWDIPITECGTQPIAYNEVYALGTVSVKCFNDDGDPMNFSAYTSNYTVNTGGALTAKCQADTTSRTGAPYGGLLILELNTTTWKENDVGVQWKGQSLTKVTVPNAYSLSRAGGAARAYEIPPFGAQTSEQIIFYVSAQAETDVNPAAVLDPTMTNYGDGIAGYIIPENCYEEEDVSPSEFRCGMEDMDSTFTAPGGTTKDTAQIGTFLISVD